MPKVVFEIDTLIVHILRLKKEKNYDIINAVTDHAYLSARKDRRGGAIKVAVEC